MDDRDQLAGAEASPPPPPRYFSPMQMTVATFLGLPIAGAWLFAANFRGLELRHAARVAIGLGFGATLAAEMILQGSTYIVKNLIVMLWCSGMIHLVAKAWQQERMAALFAAPALRRSNWKVLGVATICSLIHLALALFLAWGLQDLE